MKDCWKHKFADYEKEERALTQINSRLWVDKIKKELKKKAVRDYFKKKLMNRKEIFEA